MVSLSRLQSFIAKLIRSIGNETEVGKGIKASGVPREEIFLTTKLNNINHKEVESALLDSLAKLDTPYVNLCMY